MTTTTALSGRLTLRAATLDDLPAVHDVAARAVHELLGGHFLDPAQLAAAAAVRVYEVEPALVRAGTYLVAEVDGEVVACGGWSGDGALHPDLGPGHARQDVRHGTAGIRAVYVDPRWARRGLASLIVRTSETAAAIAGHRRFDALCTPPSEALLRTLGYAVAGYQHTHLAEGISIRVALMRKDRSAMSAVVAVRPVGSG